LADFSSVSVVILNYNTRDLLERFVPVLKQHSGNAQLVVADNASSDTSVAYLKKAHTDVKVICLEENFGFCKGYNEALKQIETKYTVLLNSDVEVTENWLAPLIDCLEGDTTIAACQPKIKSYHQKKHFEYAGAAGGFIDYLGYPFCRGRVFDFVEEDKGQYDKNMQVFWASGACMCIRTDVFKEFGGFDSDFFAHMEEIDLCWRWQLAGYSIFSVSESVVYHIGGGTLAYNNPRKVYFNFRNGLFLLFKNLSKERLLPIIFLRMLLDGVAGIKFLLQGEKKAFFAVLSAHLDFYKSLKLLRRKRKTIEHRTAINTMHPKSVVLAFFLKGQKTFNKIKT